MNLLEPAKMPVMTYNNPEPLRAMIVDDHPYIRQLMGKMLEYRAVLQEVDTGSSVLEAYMANRPDILFLDLHIPERSGKDLLHDILAHDAHAFVVILSGDSSSRNVIDMVQKGAKGFMTKPFTRDVVRRYMDLAFQHKEQLKL